METKETKQAPLHNCKWPGECEVCDTCDKWLPALKKWEKLIGKGSYHGSLHITLGNDTHTETLAYILATCDVCNECKHRECGDNGMSMPPLEYARLIMESIISVNVDAVKVYGDK